MLQSQPQRFAVAWHINFLELLRQPDDRDFFEAEFLQFPARGIQLSLAAVYQDEIG